MKRIKRIASLILAMAMVFAMSVTVFAQTVEPETADADNASITIKNPAKGETYSLHKLFDATVSEDGENIAYQGEVPESLSTYFTADEKGNISPAEVILEKDADGKVTGTKMTPELQAALETWANSSSSTTATATSNGDASLVFTGLPYGYYVVTTSHMSDAGGEGEDAKAAITVTSTQPNADIYDKNVNEPSASKTVEKESYSIGDIVKYTGTFDTTNYIGDTGATSKQVVDYLIQDTLPEYLANVRVTKITIGETEVEHLDSLQFGKVTVGNATYEKAILIPWADLNGNTYTNKYEQGAKIVIEYEATLTSVTNINTDDKNTISIRPIVVEDDSTEKEPWNETWKDTAVIRTYAAAIKKVDEDNNPLAGATFTIKGLVVEAGDEGVYTVVSYNPAEDAGESVELVTDAEGKLYILGLAKDVKLTVTEFKAPDGYNKLTEPKELTPQLLTEAIFATAGERYYDEDGNLVSESSSANTTVTVEKNLSELDTAALEIVNKRGSLLPSTGGIGTTIFYTIGGILVVGAGILLVAKKRMSAR